MHIGSIKVAPVEDPKTANLEAATLLKSELWTVQRIKFAAAEQYCAKSIIATPK